MMLLKQKHSSNSISDHLFTCNRRPAASETTALSLLLYTFENNLRLRLLSLVPAPEPLTLPYLSRAVDILASTHADARDLLSDPAVLSSYLDTSILLLDACNAILVEIERLRHGDLHLRLAYRLLLNGGSNTSKARASIHEWEKQSAISVVNQRTPTFHGRKGLTASNKMPAIARAIYAVETVSWLVAGAVMSAIGGGGVSTVRVSGEFAWAGAYNELAARIGRGGELEERSSVEFSVRRLSYIIDGDGDGDGDGGAEEKTEKIDDAAMGLEGTVGKMTEGLDRLGDAVDGLFRSVMGTRATALGGFPAGAETWKSIERNEWGKIRSGTGGMEERMLDPVATDPAASRSARMEAAMALSDGKKQGLGWVEWGRGWCNIVHEFLFQRISASHLDNPLPLPPLNGLISIVTGCTSGIGVETARQMAEAGAHVVMAVRKTNVAHELIQEWQSRRPEEAPLLDVEVTTLDLLYLNSIVEFADKWNARQGPLHVLINNAGMFSIGERQKFSKDGYEQHMQVNHLAPALLSMLLIPSLLRGSPSRIVNVNSIMHFVGFVDANDMNLDSGKRKYSSLAGYSNSKLAEVKFSSILHKRLPAESGISVVCASPGIVDTNVARDLPRIIQAGYHLIPYFIFSPLEGSRSSLFAATDPQVQEYCGMLKTDEWPVCAFISHDCRPMNPSEEAFNLESSQRIWEKTLDLVGLPSDALEKFLEGDEVQCRYRPTE